MGKVWSRRRVCFPGSVVGIVVSTLAFVNIFNLHMDLVGDLQGYFSERSHVPPLEGRPDPLSHQPEGPHQGIRLQREKLMQLMPDYAALNETSLNGTLAANTTRGRWEMNLNLTAVDEAIESDSKRGQLRLPNLLLIGAQKAGSSAVAHWLFDHGACRPLPFPGENIGSHRKEVHFFDKDSRYEQGIKFYAKRFCNCTNEAYVLDATPAYLPFPERVRATYDEAGNDQAERLKIVVVLREPVARDLSVYNHKAKLFRDNSTHNRFWKSVVDGESGSILPFSRYAKKVFYHILHPGGPCAVGPISNCYGLYVVFLKRWMQLFDHKQLLVLSYDELVRDEAKLMWRLRTFLKFRDNDSSTGFEKVNDKVDSHKISLPTCKLQKKMAKGYDVANRELYKLLAKKNKPFMEQRPFPRFVLSNCTTDEPDDTNS